MKQAFSLVELSIVLVILGLLTGGILTGQNLIRAAELRSVSTEYSSYKTAINTFRDKYFAIPGDMNNASDFWSTSTSGNGNGDIEAAGGATTAGEMFGFFDHLAKAGLIEGTYSGNSGTTGDHALISSNVPKSKLGNAGWSVESLGTIVNTSLLYYEGSYGNIFHYGSQDTDDPTIGTVLSADETWNIDTKIDDGRPGQGVLRTREDNGSATAGAGCVNAAAAATNLANTVEYDLTASSTVCSLIFKVN